VDVIQADCDPRLASYLAKYFSKNIHDDRLLGQKLYVCSRNVYRPTVFSNTTYFDAWGTQKEGWNMENIEPYILGDKSIDKVVEFDTLNLGRCVYKLYN